MSDIIKIKSRLHDRDLPGEIAPGETVDLPTAYFVLLRGGLLMLPGPTVPSRQDAISTNLYPDGPFPRRLRATDGGPPRITDFAAVAPDPLYPEPDDLASADPFALGGWR